MKKSKFLSAIVSAAFAALQLTSFVGVTASAEDVDLDGTYHAYIGVQSASYMFRNAYDDATYGYGIVAEDGTVWFDQVTAWDGPTAVNKPTTFNDCEITGNGTYSVSMSDFDFGADETFNLLFVSTDIPLNETIKITDVKVKMDNNTKYTFDEAFMDPDAKIMMKWLAINIWNGDLGGKEGLFGYIMPRNNVEIQFTVSGFNYDKPVVEEPAVTEPVTEATTTETTTEATTTVAETTTTAAATTTEAVTTAATTAAASSDSDSSGSTIIIVVVIAVALAAVCVGVVVGRRKK